MEVLHESKFYKIEFDHQRELFRTTWTAETADMGSATMRKEITKCSELISVHKPKFFLGQDKKRMNSYVVEEQKWVATTFATASISVGLKKFAIVNPEELVVEMSTEQTVDEVSDLPFEVDFFDSEEEAMNWLFA